MGKILRKTVSRGGKAIKSPEKRFRAAGKGANSPKNAFRRAKSIFKKPPSPPREAPPGPLPYKSFLLRPKSLTYYIRNE